VRRLPCHIRLGRDERGVAVLEFGIVSLLLMMMIYGVLTFGFVFALDHNLNHAASEGARAAILKSTTSATTAEVEQFAVDTARARLSFQAAEDHAEIAAAVDACSNDPAVDCITVTIDYDYDTHPIVPRLFGLGVSALNATAVVQLD
jgi:Flp pilus assembly protein TadG